MMEVLWIFALGGAVLLWMGFPLWRGRAQPDAGSDASVLQDLLFQKENLLAAARDLDFDLETDKLSPEDHRLLRERCQLEAVAVMERLETVAPPPSSPEAAVAAEPPRPAPAPLEAAVKFCPRCGRKSLPPHKFCAACGLPLSGAREERGPRKGETRERING